MRLALVWTGLAVSALFAYLAVRSAHPRRTWDAIVAADVAWLVPSIVLLVVAFYIRAIRWRSLFSPSRRPPLSAVVRALFLGYLGNTVLPARAGEAARTVALNRSAQTPVAEIVGTVMIERTYDVLSLVVLLFALWPWLPPVSWLSGAAAIGGALVAGLLVVALLVVLWEERPLHFLLRPLRRIPLLPTGYLDRAPGEFLLGLSGLLRPSIGLVAFGWTTLSWLVLGLAYWIAMLAFHLDLSPVAGILVVIGIGLALILPSSPAALGVFEAATVVVVRGAYGVDDSDALSYALVLHALNVAPILVVVVLLVAIRRLRGERPLQSELDSPPLVGRSGRRT